MLSILTNFGCHWSCRYCVYRENGINIKITDYRTFGWKELEEELKQHKGELVSISGGGDPLYDYNKDTHRSKMFYNKLFLLLEKYNCILELHTSILIEEFPYDKCERVVFHLTTPTQIGLINNRLFELPKLVRVVFVVQDYYTNKLILQIVRYVNDNNNAVNELSFRQMIGSNGETKYYCHEFLKQGHMKLWYYIEQCDYNEYFVDDHIEREYLKIK
ncbi:hypothetical protein [Clostridium rectalis]|uniref:hypothetical protein n=1 Tax=Clostridium rectalis TaxID=2040295 RepID=UPI000F6446FD|nr:hypothetical protein [Clostridium rectalis]